MNKRHFKRMGKRNSDSSQTSQLFPRVAILASQQNFKVCRTRIFLLVILLTVNTLSRHLWKQTAPAHWLSENRTSHTSNQGRLKGPDTNGEELPNIVENGTSQSLAPNYPLRERWKENTHSLTEPDKPPRSETRSATISQTGGPREESPPRAPHHDALLQAQTRSAGGRASGQGSRR